MPVMSGKRAFLDLLKQEGVGIVFGNPGTTELPLMDAFAVENDIRYILGLQEAALMAMADGYAQASGKLTVLNLHVAPGLGNAMGMLYDAQMAGSPILVTAGQQDTEYLIQEPILSADLPTLARPFVKFSAQVERLKDLPTLVHRAAKTALAPPTGPVFLALPGDILKNDGDIDLLEPTRVAPRMRGDIDAVNAAADLLAKAERPVIIAGDAVAQSRAHKELAALAEADRRAGLHRVRAEHRVVPLLASALPRLDDPLAAGRARGARPARPAVLGRRRHVHLVAAVEDRADAAGHAAHPSRHRPLADRQELSGAGRHPRRSEGDAARHHRGGPRAHERRRQGRRGDAAASPRPTPSRPSARRSAPRPARMAGKTPVQPLALLEAIGAMLPKDAVVIEEVLSSAPGARSLINSDDEQSFFALRGGGIGWGLPAAIGAKLALPDRPVVALIGDGSAMYTVQALWTAAHYKLPVIWVIFNNTSYRILKQRLVNMRGPGRAGRQFRRHGVDRSGDRFRRPRPLARHRRRSAPRP